MAKDMADGYLAKVQEKLELVMATIPAGSSKTVPIADRTKIREATTAMALVTATLVGLVASLQLAVDETTKKLAEANAEVEVLRRRLAEVATTASPQSARTTYAAAVRKNEIFISSSDEKTTSDEIKKTIKEKVDPVKGGVGIAKMVKLPNNMLKLACDSTRDLQWVKKAIQDTTDLQVRAKTFRLPCVKLFGIPRNATVEEICHTLFAQNDFVRRMFRSAEECVKEVSIRRRFFSVKDDWNHSVVLQIPAALFQAMRQNPVRYGFECFWAQEFLEPKRCYNCQQFGHVSKECKGKEVCKKCGQEGHRQKECKAEKPTCAVCALQNLHQEEKKSTDHWVASSKCTVGRNLEERLRKTVDYGH